MAISNIDQLIVQMEDLLRGSSAVRKPAISVLPVPSAPSDKLIVKRIDQKPLADFQSKPLTSFQSPIKGTYYNSGAYSPHARTDWRHKTHDGVDLRTSGGTSVYPMADGKVASISSGGKGGNTITILYPGNVKSYYAHLGTVAVHKGDRVFKNTVVGSVGDSGNAAGTAPHVHVQVWQNGQLQDPGKFFMVPQFTPMSKNEKMWLSNDARQEAHAFSMRKHLSEAPKAFASKIFDIIKLADEYLNNANN